MANEHESNKSRGTKAEGGEQQPPAPKPPATPQDIARAISDVSARISDLYPQEQLRILAAVRLTNGLQESAQQRPTQQRQTQSNNTGNNNNRGGGR